MEEQLKDDNDHLKDRDVIYNNDIELNDNDNLDYHKKYINETVERDDYYNNAYGQFLKV